MVKHLGLRAYGKINLGLDVLRKREDGYHEVRMIMQTVGIYDKIDMTCKEEPGITIDTNLYYLQIDKSISLQESRRDVNRIRKHMSALWSQKENKTGMS